MKLAPPATHDSDQKGSPCVWKDTVFVSALYKFKLGQRYRVRRQPGVHSSPILRGNGSTAEWVAELMFGEGWVSKSGFEEKAPRGPNHKNLRSPEIKEPLQFCLTQSSLNSLDYGYLFVPNVSRNSCPISYVWGTTVLGQIEDLKFTSAL